jgi:cytochrome P450
MDKKRLPPLAKGAPLLGSLLDMRRDALGFMTRDLPKYGDVVRIRVGPMEAYVVSYPEDVEYVLRGNHRNFIKNNGTRKVLAEVLGQGLLTSEGD